MDQPKTIQTIDQVASCEKLTMTDGNIRSQIISDGKSSHAWSKKKKTPLQYTYDYILEKIVRRFNCTLLYRLYDVLYVIILLYSILY